MLESQSCQKDIGLSRRVNAFLLLTFVLLFGMRISAQEFAGSETCKACHLEIYEQYRQSGHAYVLQNSSNSQPSYPAGTTPGVLGPPAGKTWKDVSYVIGGFGWKARFMDKEGYILTGVDRQYNLPNTAHGKDAQWVPYDIKRASRKPYTCGACHTTGWVSTGPEGPHQEGLPGIHGTWVEPGVTCEACHGPGAAHVAEPKTVKMSSEERCGACHVRGDVTRIDARDGLIRHHEQYKDLLASPHKGFPCSSCHDPHQSTKYQKGGYKSDDVTCKACHADIKIKMDTKANFACSSCHMPFAVESAVSTVVSYSGGAVRKGDIRSHIQRIQGKPNWNMFTADGRFVRLDDDNKAYVTLDHACLSCHTTKGIDWAARQAKLIH